MKKLLFIIAIAGIAHYFFPNFAGSFLAGKSAFTEDGSPEIIVFTMDNCGTYCSSAVAKIKTSKIPFREINLNKDPDGEAIAGEYGISTRRLPGIIMGDTRIQGYDPGRIRSALAEHFGPEALTGPERRVMKSHFYKDGTPKFVMYGTSWCPYCKKLREHLQDKNIPFTEVDVEKNETGMGYYKVLNGSGYPLSYIGYREIRGADFDEIDQAIDELMSL